MRDRDQGLELALCGAGGVRPLARALGYPASKVCRWVTVPKDDLLAVAKASGVDAVNIRPDLAEWIDAERHRDWLARARQRMGLTGTEGAKATARRVRGDAAVMDVLDLGLVIAAVRFAARERDLTTHAVMSAKGGTGGAPTPEQSARALAMGLAVTVGRVTSEVVAGVMGGTRQAVDSAAERYLRLRDGDDEDDLIDGRVIERGRLRRAKAASEKIWALQQQFVAELGGGE